MEAKEERGTAVVDIPGAFLQRKDSNGTIIKLQGAVVEAMLIINPSWQQYVVHEGRKNNPTIYSESLKTLYGIVDASKLFFDDLTSFLVRDIDFTANPFDACVVNKRIEEKQRTITWHVDDLKISHKNTNVVTSTIESLSAKYGITMPLSIVRGKVHEYLGMTFDITKK